MGRKLNFEVGHQFEGTLWIYKGELNKEGNRPRRVIVECLCGTKKDIYLSDIRKGSSKSCGCLPRVITHGKANHPLYKTHRDMLRRCYDEKSMYFHLYGGRGIKVCDRWRDPEKGIDNFIHDMGDRSDGYSLDRIDTNGDYAPEKNERCLTNLMSCCKITLNDMMFDWRGL